jgi:hypothetical protein
MWDARGGTADLKWDFMFADQRITGPVIAA